MYYQGRSLPSAFYDSHYTQSWYIASHKYKIQVKCTSCGFSQFRRIRFVISLFLSYLYSLGEYLSFVATYKEIYL